LLAQRQARDTPAVREKSEVTDAYEPFGKHVEKEAAQELCGGKRHLAWSKNSSWSLP
jgi:hypothetical protein